MPTLAVLGAYGTMGRLIARAAARKNFDLVLAGRRADQLMELSSTFRSGQARAAVVDVGDAATLEPAFAEADVVLNTIGPFSAFAKPVIAACLRARTHYVDLANELSAVRSLLDRHAEARRHGIAIVTGAGFGVVATETLALIMARASHQALRTIEVVSAPAVANASPGVEVTINAGVAQGSPRFVEDKLVVGRFGDGATFLDFPGGRSRRVVPVASGDLVAAQRATRAPNAIAYAPVPEEHVSPQLRSVAMALGCCANGQRLRAELSFGEGLEASAAIAVEVAVRLASDPQPGAWTPGQLFGPDLASACGAAVSEMTEVRV